MVLTGARMTHKEITDLFGYNLWANNRLFEAVAQLPTNQYLQDLKSSHGGIHGTLTHIVAAQKIWISRWKGTPEETLLHGKDVGSLLDLIALWEQVSSDTAEFLGSLTDDRLQEQMTITTTTGKQFIHTYQQMMQHLVNHSSTHRGQVSAMIRQLGSRPPAIDLIAYYRQNQKQ
jgi:uncharacterized damage-inducible protein DinB